MFRDCLAFWEDSCDYPNDTLIKVYQDGIVLSWTSEDKDIGTDVAFFANTDKVNYKELPPLALKAVKSVLDNCYNHYDEPEECQQAFWDSHCTSALIAWEKALDNWLGEF